MFAKRFALVLAFMSIVTSDSPAGGAKSRRPCGAVPGDRAAIVDLIDGSAPCACTDRAGYVRCVVGRARDAVKAGTLRSQCRKTVVQAAKRSTCGVSGAATCCRDTKKGATICKVVKQAGACRGPKGGGARVGHSTTCFDACLPSCATATRPRAEIERAAAIALEGVDDPWGADLRLVFARATAELGCVESAGLPPPASAECTAAFCPSAGYCGSADRPPEAFYPAVGACLNEGCYQHQACYAQNCVASECYFTTQADQPGHCDLTVLGACDACLASGNASVIDELTCAIARWLHANRSEPAECTQAACAAGACMPETRQCVTPTTAPGSTTVTSTTPSTTSTTIASCPPPAIVGVAPLSGPVGTEVTITGTNLACGNTQTVTLGGVPVVITLLSSTQIRTFVPIGAHDGAFAVTTPGGTAVRQDLAYDVASAEFDLSVGPTAGSVMRGSSTSYAVRLDSSGATQFTGLASLEIEGVPTGVHASFSPATLTGNQHGMLTVTADEDAALATATLVLRATASIDGRTTSATTNLGVTVLEGNRAALLGQFMVKDGGPMPGVVLKLVSHADGGVIAETATDDAGNFVFLDPPVGAMTMSVDTTPFDPTKPMPMYAIDVSVTAGQASVLGPFKVTLPPASDAFVPIGNGAQDQVVTNPAAPGASITLPAGASVTGWDGLTKEKITIIKLAPDELPMLPPPGPTNSLYQFNFGTSMGGIPSVPLPITLPNDQGAEPGEQVDLWYYDAAPLVGAQGEWRLAGTGTVSADGSVVVADPGVGIERFCGVCGTSCMILRQAVQAARNLYSWFAADPIDLFLGQHIEEKTDLIIPGRMPAEVHRTYNPVDPFAIKGLTLGLGPGWALSVDIVLLQVSPSRQRIVLPGNARIDFPEQGVGVFVNADMPTFAGAALTAEAGSSFRLRFKDGRAWRFQPHPNPQLAGTRLLVEQVDPNGNVLTIERDGAGNITRLIEPAGRALTFSYVGNRIRQISDALGRTVQYTYSAGRLQTVTDPSGGVTTYTYDGFGRIRTIKNPRNVTTVTNQYDAEGRVVRQTAADGGSWTFEYLRPPGATMGAVIGVRVTDPRGNVTTRRFSSTGFPLEVIDALGQVTTFERDAAGRVASTTDPAGRTTRLEYDAMGNLVRMTDAANNVRRFEYEPTFQAITRLVDPLGNVTAFDYDASGNLTGITDPEQNAKPPAERLQTTIVYDAHGQPTTITDVLGNVSTVVYDAFGNPITMVDPLGNRTERTFDAASRVVTSTDPRGRTTALEYDASDRLTRIVDPVGGATRFTYDPNGMLLTVVDGRGGTTSWTYDAMDRVVRRTDPLTAFETRSYDLAGNLIQIVDRDDRATTYEYDALNRRRLATYADGGTSAYQYDAVGRVVHVNDSLLGDVVMGYDLLDRLARATSPTGSVQYGYDGAGRRTQMSASGQPTVAYEYDANSRLRRVTNGTHEIELAYDALNRRTQLLLPNGVSTEYVYDAASRLTDLVYRRGATALGSLSYAYDPAGRPRGVSGTFAQVLLPAAVAGADYDAANRQLSFGQNAMTYDASGNLTSLTNPAGATVLTWDARQRLAGISGPTDAAFTYDALGRRQATEVDGLLTQYLYDDVTTVAETPSQGSPRSYLANLGLDEPWMTTNGEFFLADAVGSIVGITDATGALTTRYRYEPFGRASVQGPSSNTLQFTARENDGTGMQYHRARYYHPSLHRFISEDPLGLGGGINVYAYAGNRPTSYTDRTGLVSEAAARVAEPILSAAFQAANPYVNDGADWLVGVTRTCGGIVDGDSRALLFEAIQNVDEFQGIERACAAHDIELRASGEGFFSAKNWYINRRLGESADQLGYGGFSKLFNGMSIVQRGWQNTKTGYYWLTWKLNPFSSPLDVTWLEKSMGLQPGESYMPASPVF